MKEHRCKFKIDQTSYWWKHLWYHNSAAINYLYGCVTVDSWLWYCTCIILSSISCMLCICICFILCFVYVLCFVNLPTGLFPPVLGSPRLLQVIPAYSSSLHVVLLRCKLCSIWFQFIPVHLRWFLLTYRFSMCGYF